MKIASYALALALLRACDGTNCCKAPYAPTDDGCDSASNSSTNLVCLSHVSSCQTCIVSAATPSGTECSSCCARKKEECDTNGETQKIIWIAAAVVSIFLCASCSGLCVCFEKKRRRDGITVAEAYSVSHVMATAQVVIQNPMATAVAEADAPQADGIEAIPVSPARPSQVGVPLAETGDMMYDTDTDDEFREMMGVEEPPIASVQAAGAQNPMDLGLELGQPISRTTLLDN